MTKKKRRYESRVFDGRIIHSVEIDRIHKEVLDFKRIKAVTLSPGETSVPGPVSRSRRCRMCRHRQHRAAMLWGARAASKRASAKSCWLQTKLSKR